MLISCISSAAELWSPKILLQLCLIAEWKKNGWRKNERTEIVLWSISSQHATVLDKAELRATARQIWRNQKLRLSAAWCLALAYQCSWQDLRARMPVPYAVRTSSLVDLRHHRPQPLGGGEGRRTYHVIRTDEPQRFWTHECLTSRSKRALQDRQRDKWYIVWLNSGNSMITRSAGVFFVARNVGTMEATERRGYITPITLESMRSQFSQCFVSKKLIVFQAFLF